MENLIHTLTPLSREKEYSVLFVGNSATYVNDVPLLVLTMAQQEGYKLSVDSLVKGGVYLSRYADPEDDLGQALDEKLENSKFDFVVLQENSKAPAVSQERFFAAMRILCDKVRQHGAIPVIYGRAAYKNGCKHLETLGLTHETMTESLAASYKYIAEELQIDLVAYACLAIQEMALEHDDVIDMYGPDQAHHSLAGSYTVALTIFGTIFGLDPAAIPCRNDAFPEAAEKLMRRAASNAMKPDCGRKETVTYLFDLDGTLIDSMPFFSENMIKFFDDNNLQYPADVIKIISPLGYAGTAEYAISLGLKATVEEFIQKTTAFIEPAYRSRIPAKESVVEKLQELKKAGHRLCVLTASPHSLLDPCLQRLGMVSLFDQIWSSDDFGLTKSDPEIYRQAALRLNTTVDKCTFVDDNIHAISTAKRAGMYAVGVFDESSRDYAEEMKKAADKYILSFREL